MSKLNIIKDAELNLYNNFGIVTIYAKQNDTARCVQFTILDNFEEFQLPVNDSDFHVFIKEKLPDNSVLLPIEIEASNITENTITVPLTAEMLSQAGVCICELVMIRSTDESIYDEKGNIKDSSTEILSTATFNLYVEATINTDSSVDAISKKRVTDIVEAVLRLDTISYSEDEREASELQRVASEGQRLSAELSREANEANRTKAEALRVDHETNRITAEQTREKNELQRVASESQRSSAELSREKSETERVTNEQQRVSAELAREENEVSRVKAEEQRSKEYTNIAKGIETLTTQAKQLSDSFAKIETSANQASVDAQTALNASKNASECSVQATNSKNDSEAYANGTRDGKEVEESDKAFKNNAKYYLELIRANAVGGFVPQGTITFSELPDIATVRVGDMWNISDDFVTTDDFHCGANVSCVGGANVYKTADGKWDIKADDKVMTGATKSTNGTSGTVTAPLAGQQNATLMGDGKWSNVLWEALSRLQNPEQGIISSIQKFDINNIFKTSIYFAWNCTNAPYDYGVIMTYVTGQSSVDMAQIFIAFDTMTLVFCRVGKAGKWQDWRLLNNDSFIVADDWRDNGRYSQDDYVLDADELYKCLQSHDATSHKPSIDENNYWKRTTITEEIKEMKKSFQNGVEVINKAVKAIGGYPLSSTPKDIATAISHKSLLTAGRLTTARNQYGFSSKWSLQKSQCAVVCQPYYMWTDGIDLYYSQASIQLVFDKAQATWKKKQWFGLDSFYGEYIWTDNKNIYYSEESKQYILDIDTSTWKVKTWDGISIQDGEFVWSDGLQIFYSNLDKHYVLDIDTNTWKVKTWNGLETFDGDNIWTDGRYVYMSGGQSYILQGDTWIQKTWNELKSIYGRQIWTDRYNVYFSAGKKHYILDKDTDTWKEKIWVGLDSFYGKDVWSDGYRIYHYYDDRDLYRLDSLYPLWSH